MNFYVAIIFIIVLLILIYVCNDLIIRFNNKLTFCPTELSRKDYEIMIQNLGSKYKPFEIKIDENTKIYGGLFSLVSEPKFTDDLILYSHGNGGNISYLLNSDSIKNLASKYTVVVYDYRGYGISKGVPSENGVYEDVNFVWKYLINHGANAQNIIIYGHSMGGALSSYLVKELTDEKIYPKMLILESTFTSHKDIAKDFLGIIGNLSIYDFDNIKNIKRIDQKIPVYVFHSREDEIIPYRHGIKFKNTKRCFFQEISGGHNNPIYGNIRDKILNKYK